MTGFFADPPGMDGLYNQLLRAQEDAEAAKRYLETYADMSMISDVGDEGLIFDLLNVHDHAYSSIHGAFDKLGQISSASATLVNQCQVEYGKSDTTAAANLDAQLPGATNPGELHYLLQPPTYGSSSPASAPFTDSADAAGQFTCAPVAPADVGGMPMDPLTDVLSPSAWVRSFVKWLSGWDPFEKVFTWMTGDWDAYARCSEVWSRLAVAAPQISQNLFNAAQSTSTVWRGNAAESCQEQLVNLSTAVYELGPACTTLSEQYLEAAQAAKNLHEVFTTLLGLIIDYGIAGAVAAGIGTATAETGVGAVAGYSVAAFVGAEILELVGIVNSVYGVAKATFSGISGVVGAVNVASMDALPIPDVLATAD